MVLALATVRHIVKVIVWLVVRSLGHTFVIILLRKVGRVLVKVANRVVVGVANRVFTEVVVQIFVRDIVRLL